MIATLLSLFLPFFFFFFFFLTLSAFAGADTGAKDPESIVTKEAKEPVPNIQVVEA